MEPGVLAGIGGVGVLSTVEILIIFQGHLESYLLDPVSKLHQHLRTFFYPTYIKVSHTTNLEALKYLSNCYSQATE